MTREYCTYNAVGHTVALTDALGNLTKTTTYEAFGNEAASTGTSANNRLANTKERDFSIGLDNHGYRYYDPSTGRYTTRDPIGYGDGLNVYAHVQNNPVNHVDPLGLDSTSIKNFGKLSDGSTGWLFHNNGFATSSPNASAPGGTFTYYGTEFKVSTTVPFQDGAGLARLTSLAGNARTAAGFQNLLRLNDQAQLVVQTHAEVSPKDAEVAEGLANQRRHLAEGKSESEFIAAVSLGVAITVASIAYEPVDWVLTGLEIIRDPTNPLSYAGLSPFIATGMAKMSDETFDALVGGWRTTSVHTDKATRKGARKSGISIQEKQVNTLTGETRVQHTVLNDTGKVVDGPHTRPNYKSRPEADDGP